MLRTTRIFGLMLIIQFMYLCYIGWFYKSNGYLPSPFLYDKFDTFMDFFSPMYWIGKKLYTEWRSVYPPLNFDILYIFKKYVCTKPDAIDPYIFRTSCALGPYIAALIYAICCIVSVAIVCAYEKIEPIITVLLILILTTSFPVLFALERGNLIFITLPFVALCISSKVSVRVIAYAITVNLKPYFLIPFLFVCIKEGKAFFLSVVLVALSVFLLSALPIKYDNPMALFGNYINYATSSVYALREVVAMPSSISSYIYITQFDRIKDLWEYVHYVEIPVYAILAYTVCNILYAIYVIKSRENRLNELAILGFMSIPVFLISAGGYSLVLLMPFMPFLYKRYRQIFYVLILIYLPLDTVCLYSADVGYEIYSYLGGKMVNPQWFLTAGFLFKPLALLTASNLFCFKVRCANNLMI